MTRDEMDGLKEDVKRLFENGEIKNWSFIELPNTITFTFVVEAKLKREMVMRLFLPSIINDHYYKRYNDFCSSSLIHYYGNDIYRTEFLITVHDYERETYKFLYARIQSAIHNFFNDMFRCIE